ncbi:tandem-95 repeat protein, partial [Candidatus Poribacteria bacterium]|nr:tandem-95 repeat protein [Candidatus Poribacteria bacterium]
YTPAADFHGDDTFEFVVDDGELQSDPVTVTLTVTPVNDAPTAADTIGATTEDAAVTITLAGSDVDGDAVTVLLWDGVASVSTDITSAQAGAVSIGATSGDAATATYTPASDFNGADSFEFVVSDGQTESVPVTVTLTVSSVNDAPVAAANAAETDEDVAVAVALAGTDVDGDVLTVFLWDGAAQSTSVASAVGGAVSISDATATYSPPADYHGDDTFEFIVTDGLLESDPVIASLTVSPANDAPEAADASGETPEDTDLLLTLAGSDVDGDAVTVLLWDGAGGVLTAIPTAEGGSVSVGETTTGVAMATYTPAPDFHGVDSFEFVASDGQADSALATVTVTVDPVNDVPVPSPAAAETAEDTPVTLTLTGDDVDGDALVVLLWDGAAQTASMASAAGGLVSISATSADIATATYTPPADFNGSDSFDFVVDDGTVDSPSISVSVTVTAVDDPPVADAVSEALAVWENGSLDIDLSGSDVDSAALSFSLGDASVPFPTLEMATTNGGAVTLSDADPSDALATATYVPPADYDSVDTFSFRVSDGATESPSQDISVTVTTLPRVSIEDSSETEGSSGSPTISFTVSLSKVHDAPVTVEYATADGEALDTVDYDGLSAATASIAVGELTTAILVPIAPDVVHEADETFSIFLTGATDAVIAASTATGTIADDDDITLVIADVTVDEGATAADVVVSTSGPTEQTVTLDFVTQDGTAVADEDYAPTTLTAAVVDAASGSLSIPVPITDDATNEAIEEFTGAISNATGRGVTIAGPTAIVTIVDDDALALTIEDTSIGEPDADSVTAFAAVALTGASAQAITVAYTTVAQTAAEGVDYTPAAGSITIPAGEIEGAIPVDILGDAVNEADEAVVLSIDSITGDGVIVTDGDATLTILDNDDLTLSIADTVTSEELGAVASFAVDLSGVSEQTVTVRATTQAGSAAADVDYVTPVTGSVTFAPGVSATTFDVSVVDDTVHEADETFSVTLTDPTGRGITIAAASATATVQDTDALTLSVADATVTEGDAEDAALTFDVSLSGASEETIAVDFVVTGNETDGATEGSDFATPDPATVTFSPGATTAEATVTVAADTLNEADEGVTLTLSGTDVARVTIADGEAAGVILDNDDITLSIADAAVDEGAEASVTLTLPVTLSAASEQTITTSYTTTDGSASGGSDYTVITDGPLTFAPGVVSADALISVQGDTTYEADETITATLSGPTARGVTLADVTATATIRNDDAAPTMTVADVTATEGYDDTATFTLALTGDTEEDVTVSYATAPGTATAPDDYVEAEGMLTLTAGSTSAAVVVTLADDSTAEPEETFTLALADATNATLDVTAATAVITDDDHPPLTVTSPTSVSEGGAATFSAEIVLPVSSVTSATLFYGEGGSPLDLSAPFAQQSDTLWTATAPADSVTTRGLLWRVEVVDDGEQAFVAPDNAEASHVPVSGTALLSLATMAGPPNVWNAVAAPIQPDDVAMSSTFDGDVGGFLDEWFAWRWNALTQGWEVAESLADDTPVASDSFDVGKGWLVAVVGDGSAETRVVSGQSVDSASRYPLPISAGWNLLANPYGFPVAWSDASVSVAVGNSLGPPSELGTLVDNRLLYLDTATQSYVARQSDEESPYAVPPGQAWWFYSTAAGELLFDATAVDDTQATVAAPRDPVGGASAWRVLLSIESDAGSDQVEAAVSPAAPAPPVGMLRHVKPPRFPASAAPRIAFVDLSATGTPAELARSARSSDDEITWIVEVTNGSGAVLRWLPIGAPADYDLRLVDLVTGRALDLRAESRVRLEGSGYDSRRFALQAVRRARPDVTRLLANYPNPFNPETWIPFELDIAADVTIRIYDMRGALVRRLDLGRREPGYYTDPDAAAYWNGRNADGEPVVSGPYFYTLDAGEFRSTRRMVILK